MIYKISQHKLNCTDDFVLVITRQGLLLKNKPQIFPVTSNSYASELLNSALFHDKPHKINLHPTWLLICVHSKFRDSVKMKILQPDVEQLYLLSFTILKYLSFVLDQYTQNMLFFILIWMSRLILLMTYSFTSIVQSQN